MDFRDVPTALFARDDKGRIADFEAVKPLNEIHCASKMCELPEGLPKFDGFPPFGDAE
jgi:hypothetical protein